MGGRIKPGYCVKKKALIFFSAGLGDAVLLIPLVKELKCDGFAVTALFNSAFPCEEIFEDSTLFEKKIVLKSKLAQMIFVFLRLNYFDKSFVNYFASNRSNLLTAALCSRKVFTNKSFSLSFFKKKITYVIPQSGLHDAEQNVCLYKKGYKLEVSDLFFEFESSLRAAAKQFPIDSDRFVVPPRDDDKQARDNEQKYIVLQLSAGNNIFQYKNWPLSYWKKFLNLFFAEFPSQKILLAGDKNEVSLAEKIAAEFPGITSKAGQTSVSEVIQLLSNCKLFIGLDGGLTHLAAALQKPTFSIWGPSSSFLYGYERFDAVHHQCADLHLPCSPCSAWIDPNKTRVDHPAQCPDHACLQSFLPENVFAQYRLFVNSLPPHVR